MNDYGFMTFDENGKKINGSVNSKWPIFGPRYSDIKHAFKTIHFTDTKQYEPKASPSVSLPDIQFVDGQYLRKTSEFHGYEKSLVATIPHGYKKRPLGYATISGTFVKNTRGKWIWDRHYDRPFATPSYPPSATLYGVGTERGTMLGTGDGLLRGVFDSGDYSVFSLNYFGDSNISYPSSSEAWWWWLTDGGFAIPGKNSATQDQGYNPPYTIEIDDENVYLYRYYYWCDVYRRMMMGNGYGTLWYDVRSRSQGVIDYAGSDFDVTIYLCPYSMEDLL